MFRLVKPILDKFNVTAIEDHGIRLNRHLRQLIRKIHPKPEFRVEEWYRKHLLPRLIGSLRALVIALYKLKARLMKQKNEVFVITDKDMIRFFLMLESIMGHRFNLDAVAVVVWGEDFSVISNPTDVESQLTQFFERGGIPTTCFLCQKYVPYEMSILCDCGYVYHPECISAIIFRCMHCKGRVDASVVVNGHVFTSSKETAMVRGVASMLKSGDQVTHVDGPEVAKGILMKCVWCQRVGAMVEHGGHRFCSNGCVKGYEAYKDFMKEEVVVVEKGEEDGEECSICLGDFERGEGKTPCPNGHSFHSDCWVIHQKACRAKQKTLFCPMCMQLLT